ncbi:Trypsin-like serine protease [Balamuthia mandrillaris]
MTQLQQHCQHRMPASYHSYSGLLVLCLLAALPFLAAQEETARVFEGEKVADGVYPWQGALYFQALDEEALVYDTQLCGCTLISPRHVLTAAHCVTDENGKVGSEAFSVLFNTTDITISQKEASTTLAHLKFDVVKKKVHPDYDHLSVVGDFAVLQLDREVEGITPIALDATANSDDWSGQSLRFIGWGVTDYFGPAYYSTLLLQNDLLAQTAEECVEAYYTEIPEAYEDFILDLYRTWYICGIDDPQNGGVGRGDSGGPLFLDSDPPVLVGVTSWGVPLYGDDSEQVGTFPNVWAYVATARQWILKQTGENPEDGDDGGSEEDGGDGDSAADGDGSGAASLESVLSFL